MNETMNSPSTEASVGHVISEPAGAGGDSEDSAPLDHSLRPEEGRSATQSRPHEGGANRVPPTKGRGVARSPAHQEAGSAARGKKRKRRRELAVQSTDRVRAGTASPALAPASPRSPCGAGRGREDLAEGAPPDPGIAPERRAFGRPVPAPARCGLHRARPAFGFPAERPVPCGLRTRGGPLRPRFPPLGDPLLLVAPAPGRWVSPAAPLPSTRSPPPGGLSRAAPCPGQPLTRATRPLALRERPPTPTKRGRSRSRARPLDFLCLRVPFCFSGRSSKINPTASAQ